MPQHGTHNLWLQSGDMKDKGMTIYCKLLDHTLNNYVLVVRYHTAVAYLLSASFECILEQGLCNLPFSDL